MPLSVGARVTLPFWAGDAPSEHDLHEVEEILPPDNDGTVYVRLVMLRDGEREKTRQGHFRRERRTQAEVIADIEARA